MLTARDYSYLAGSILGLVAVNILFLGMFLYRMFSQVSSTKTSGAAGIVGDVISTLTSPVFLALAVLLFGAIFYFYIPRLPQP